MYLRVSPSFVVRPISGDGTYLINSENGDYWDIDTDELAVLSFLDGSRTEAAVRDQFPEIDNVTEYITNLIEEGIVEAIETASVSALDVRPQVQGPHLNDVLIEVTGKCNLKCGHCFNSEYSDDRRALGEFRTEELLHLVDQLDSMNVRRVQLSGGEAFLRKDIWKVLERIKDKKIFLDVISTNGTAISKAVATKLAPYFQDGGALYISLDGASASSHDKLRGDGAFAKTLRGIRNLNSVGCRVLINTMVHRFNVHELDHMYDLLAEFKNVIGWRLGIPKALGRFVENCHGFDVPPSIAVGAVSRVFARRLTEDVGLKVEVGDFFRTEVLDVGWYQHTSDDHPCKYALNNCTIKPDGDVVFCASLNSCGYGPAKIGNTRSNDLHGIWHSPEHAALRSLKVSDLNDCQGCRYIVLCGGGCRANAKLTSGRVMGRDAYSCVGMTHLENELLPLLPPELQAQFKELVRPDGWVPEVDV